MDERTKTLLKEGFYWEALSLPIVSPWPNIAIRVAEMERQCQGDHEGVILLSEARRALRGTDYPRAREVCNDLFDRIGDAFAHQILSEETIVRQKEWREIFLPLLSNPDSIKERIVSKLMLIFKHLFETSQESYLKGDIDEQKAYRAVAKSVSCLEVALIYAKDRPHIQEQLKVARELEELLTKIIRGEAFVDKRSQQGGSDKRGSKQSEIDREAMTLCNRGTERINKAQELHTIEEATLEIIKGIGDIRKAHEMAPNNSHIATQLEQAERLWNELTGVLAKAVGTRSTSSNLYNPYMSNFQTSFQTGGKVFTIVKCIVAAALLAAIITGILMWVL